MEDDPTHAIPAFADIVLLVGIGGIVRERQFQVGVGTFAVSGIERDPGRTIAIYSRLWETGAAGR
jgi:hypothetical protein